MRGKITRIYQVDCGRCVESKILLDNEKQYAIRTLRQNDWKLTKAYGWLCPRCQKEIAEGGDE
jgi:hypothetical protein